MVDTVSTLIGGRVHCLHIVKNVAIRDGIFSGARLIKLQRHTMGFFIEKQRNWFLWKARFGIGCRLLLVLLAKRTSKTDQI